MAMLFVTRLAGGMLLLWTLLLLGPGGLAQDGATERDFIRQDFRGHILNTQLFQFTSPKAHTLIVEEAEGLRIGLPGTEINPSATGILLKPVVQGDCEITTSYELLRADRPLKGRAVGVTLYVKTPSDEAIQLGHLHRPDGPSYSCDRYTWDAEKKRRSFGNRFPTEVRSGKLRLVRRGPLVTCLVAPEDQNEFQELQRFDLGTEDLVYVRVAAENAKSADPVEVRIRDFEVRALEVPLALSPEGPRRWPFMLALVSFALVVLAGSGCAWWLRRWKHSRLSLRERTSFCGAKDDNALNPEPTHGP
jgi:hypothetical protein